jgi:hypothetical protein
MAVPTIEGLDPNFQAIGTLLFVVIIAAYSAFSYITGRKQPKVETKEFALSGQLADMGPVKELVEQTGLLVQQQIRTNMHLEACVDRLGKLAEAYVSALDDQQREREEAAIEEQVSRRVEEREQMRREVERAKRRQSAARRRAVK